MIAPSMDVREADNKKAVLGELLEQGMVLVTLDARADGVDVPDHLREDPQLRLNLSFRFGLPMVLDDWGVTATLTFAGSPYPCRLPWHAVYLLVSHVTGRPILFPADVPEEFFPANVSGAAVAQLPLGGARHAPRPRLQVVTGDEEVTTSDGPKSPPRRGHLRVVK